MTTYGQIYRALRRRENELAEHSAWCDDRHHANLDRDEGDAMRYLTDGLRLVPADRRHAVVEIMKRIHP